MEYRKHAPVSDFEVQGVIDAYTKKRQESGSEF